MEGKDSALNYYVAISMRSGKVFTKKGLSLPEATLLYTKIKEHEEYRFELLIDGMLVTLFVSELEYFYVGEGGK